MKQKIFVKTVTIFASIIVVALTASIFFLKFKSYQKDDFSFDGGADEEIEYPNSFLTLKAEKSQDNKTINIYLEPTIKDEPILINAIEIDIKLLGDKFREVNPSGKIDLGQNFTDKNWTFPILIAKDLETGETDVKLAGYFNKKEGFDLNKKTVLVSFAVNRMPETEIFISEFQKDNTHFFTSELTDQIPFAVE